jgi:chromatin structure-remodeling complex subunit RSC1/2
MGQVIPEPRCLNGVSQNLQEGSYKDPLEVYDDLSLVFLNALYYNEPTSQIHKDAGTLKVRSWPVSNFTTHFL